MYLLPVNREDRRAAAEREPASLSVRSVFGGLLLLCTAIGRVGVRVPPKCCASVGVIMSGCEELRHGGFLKRRKAVS